MSSLSLYSIITAKTHHSCCIDCKESIFFPYWFSKLLATNVYCHRFSQAMYRKSWIGRIALSGNGKPLPSHPLHHLWMFLYSCDCAGSTSGVEVVEQLQSMRRGLERRRDQMLEERFAPGSIFLFNKKNLSFILHRGLCCELVSRASARYWTTTRAHFGGFFQIPTRGFLIRFLVGFLVLSTRGSFFQITTVFIFQLLNKFLSHNYRA